MAKKVSRRKARKASRIAKHAKRPEKIGVEKNLEDFSEEVSRLGERLGRKAEQLAESHKNEKPCCNPFGVVWPAISSVLGLILLGVVIWVLGIVNTQLNMPIIEGLRNFLRVNIGLLFLITLLFSYASYFEKQRTKAYKIVRPIFMAAGLVITLWLLFSLIIAAGIPGVSIALLSVSPVLMLSLVALFLILVFAGYIILLVNVACCSEVPAQVANQKAGNVKRLYRSGNDKILGGVCGGIAEYLGVDPVAIRVLWIVISFIWGTGLLAYLLAWIIIPRNPAHKWKN